MFIKKAYTTKGRKPHGGTVFSWRVLEGKEIKSRNLIFIDDDLLMPRKAVKSHKDRWDEFYYLLDGSGVLRVGSESEDVKAGDVIYIPKGCEHTLANKTTRTLRFVCVAVKSNN